MGIDDITYFPAEGPRDPVEHVSDGGVDIEAMKKVGQNFCQSEASMGPPPEGSMSWIGGQLVDAADEIERLRALVIQLARLMPGPRGREVVLTRAESDALKSAMDGES